MSICILHVGAAKTGTSSIQESLFYGLADPRFRYVNLGYLNAGAFLDAVFHPNPEQYWYHQMRKWSAEDVRRRGQRLERRLRRVLRRCRALQVTPILSAERCWVAPDPLLERLGQLLADEGFSPRVIAYVRPAKSWIESAFQQVTKLDLMRLRFEDVIHRKEFLAELHWHDKLLNFERIFGQGSLTVRVFRKKDLIDGCAVMDFCNTLGIRFDPKVVRRVNESLSLDAVRMFYAYNQFARALSPPSVAANELLELRLQDLQGEPFRFHSSVVEPVAGLIVEQNRRMLDRHGLDLSEDLAASDAGACIRTESDLFKFPNAPLEWLGRVSGQPPIAEGSGEATARKVAMQMAAAMRRAHLGCRVEVLRRRVQFRLRWLRCGD